jgi:hypothetical protein
LFLFHVLILNSEQIGHGATFLKYRSKQVAADMLPHSILVPVGKSRAWVLYMGWWMALGCSGGWPHRAVAKDSGLKRAGPAAHKGITAGPALLCYSAAIEVLVGQGADESSPPQQRCVNVTNVQKTL